MTPTMALELARVAEADSRGVETGVHPQRADSPWHCWASCVAEYEYPSPEQWLYLQALRDALEIRSKNV